MLDTELSASIDGVLIGKSKQFGAKGVYSAYVKKPTADKVYLDWNGLEGDQQADKKHHGGSDKALFHYCNDHYEAWRKMRPELSAYFNCLGAFGENLSSSVLNEENVFIGDKFKIGGAIIQVTQGRQPCWKLGYFFGDDTMVRSVIDSGKAGWYYRVLERGKIARDCRIEIIDRDSAAVSVRQAFDVIVARKIDVRVLRRLVESPALSNSWALKAQKLINRIEQR